MQKTLLSWYATANDFTHAGEGKQRKRLIQVNEDGPTFSIHQFHWKDYLKHIILFNPKRIGNPPETEYAEALVSCLRKNFPMHTVELRPLAIEDPINLEEICQKTQELLAEVTRHNPLDIFISPGTPAMQMAWIINGLNFRNRVKLFQGREARYSTTGNHETVQVNLDSSIFPRNISISQAIIETDTTDATDEPIPSGLKEAYARAGMVSKTNNITCLIMGPHGSGKERLARFIHDQSARRDKPYKAVNCAAYSDELLNSELFGYKKGAFTGANEDKKGLLESAEGGSVFLDEIGDISPKMQVALLRVIQEKEIQPIGSNETKMVDIRIIAATNRNLREEAEAGRFRWDLYYRLTVAPLELQPLVAQGRTVIKEWISKKIFQFSPDFNNEPLILTPEALDAMTQYHWPGNIRELEHTILRLYTFREKPSATITSAALPIDILQSGYTSLRLEDAEKAQIEKVLRMTNGNISRSCEILHCARNTLKAKMRNYKIKTGKEDQSES